MLRIKNSLGIRPVMPFLAFSRPAAQGTNVPVSGLGQSRGKRTGKSKRSPAAMRIVTQLSVFTARKKLPHRLKLSSEDLIRHNTIQAAWKYLMRDKRRARVDQLKNQYDKMQEACNEIEQLNPYLAFCATAREKGKRFTPELRIPTETPPKEIWAMDWKPSDVTVVNKK